MNSMTGYGRANLEHEGRQLTLEIKSVNHRFLDITFRMPRFFGFLEDDARKWIGERLNRGHIEVYVTYKNTREDAHTVKVDTGLFQAYRNALEELAAVSDTDTENENPGEAEETVQKKSAVIVHNDVSLLSLASMSDVLTVADAEEDEEAIRNLMHDAMTQALDTICVMRAREGENMRADMSGRVDTLESLVAKIQTRYPDTVTEYETRLRTRIEELLGDAQVEETRLLQEVAIMADRSAISEEIVRLGSHIAQMREFLQDTQPTGRKLDFLVQELNREVNTISSKSQDVPITQLVVAAKAEIEKIREQVQNVE